MKPTNPARAGRAVASLCFAVSLGLALASSLSGCNSADATPESESGSNASPPLTRVRVQTEAVRLGKLEGAESVTGTIRAYHRATITAETQGRVLARAVVPGAAVYEGGLLIELEASRQALEVRRTEAALATAGTVLEHAERELARGEQLIARNALSTQHHDDLKLAVDKARNDFALAEVARDTARRDLADTKIRAPFDGTVDALAVDVGDFVAPGTPVATLVDLSRVRIFGGVTAREAARLVPDTKAAIGVADLDGQSFEATLVSVARVAGQLDGTYELELGMENPGGLRDGMVVSIELRDTSGTPGLLAPRAALLRRGGQTEVFVVERGVEGAVARVRSVRTGRVDGEWVEILDGLAVGDDVIFDGHFALQDGAGIVIDGAPDPASAGAPADAFAPAKAAPANTTHAASAAE